MGLLAEVANLSETQDHDEEVIQVATQPIRPGIIVAITHGEGPPAERIAGFRAWVGHSQFTDKELENISCLFPVNLEHLLTHPFFIFIGRFSHLSKRNQMGIVALAGRSKRK